MLDFVITLPTFDKDEATKRVLSWIKERFPDMEGVGFYMHPVLMTTSGITPEITIVTRTHHPIIIRCLSYQLDDLQKIEDNFWTINDEEKDSPLLEGDDFIVNIRSKFDRDRILRDHLKPFCVLALPAISQHDFHLKFPHKLDKQRVIWADGDVTSICEKIGTPLSDDEWRTVRSIVQGINPLTKGWRPSSKIATTLGESIKSIDRDIALLDEDQVNAALSIAPGPQRIRGLAGTGKTVLLAMKAANIHLRYPDKKILFTFNTQSLYNQIQNLITKFYRNYSDKDPDWDNLHIRHAWGGPRKAGVYYDACRRLVIPPMRFEFARMKNMENPFLSCCEHLLSSNLQPVYDYIMIDEAQDFPPAFFQILYRLSFAPHNICWVYDELQSLFAEKMPTPEELFGYDNQGKPNISLDGVAYPGGIEKDLVLRKSYRCPQAVLMLAHAIGLGLYSKEGCVQMLTSKESWEALGYVVESGMEDGNFVKGKQVVIQRPEGNSPNLITERYQGKQKIIQSEIFEKREEELDWIANSILNDITVEKVSPEHIVVICLDGRKMRKYLPPLQSRLIEKGLPSSIPGLGDESSAFAEPGRVTLSTVFRAKGNESYIVYIFSFDALYDYEEALQNRNRAFTAITRSKAWVRISGIGKGMTIAKKEIDSILADQPKFKFPFPDMADIRSLDAETSRRKQAMWKARESITGIVDIDLKALEAIAAKEPELFKKFIKRIEEAKKREN